MSNIRKTANGRPIDMEALAAKHKDKVALGNMGVNAGGDKLGKGGEVVKTSSERVKDYYTSNPNTTRKTVSVKGTDEVDVNLEEDAKTTVKAKAKKNEKKSNQGKKAVIEKELPDGSIEVLDPENDEGNDL